MFKGFVFGCLILALAAFGYGCGDSGPTFDGSSPEAANESMEEIQEYAQEVVM